MIFKDIFFNLGVILADGLVYWMDSKYPDLIIGNHVFVTVGLGTVKIFMGPFLGKRSDGQEPFTLSLAISWSLIPVL